MQGPSPPSAARRRLLLALAALPLAGHAATPGATAPDAGHLLLEILFFRQPGARAGVAPVAAGSAGPGSLLGPLIGGLRHAGYPVLGHVSMLMPVAAGATGVVRLEEVAPGAGLSGRLTLTRSQILVVHLTAHCEDCTGSADLDERRRVKFGERHYFDGPVIGAIVAINPPPEGIAG